MSARQLALWLVAFSLLAPDAAALIVASAEGDGNTTAPADDFGFANVGDARQTAVYVGNGWVLTANHVQLGPVVLAGVSYEPELGSKIRMQNPWPGPSADLALFRLQEPWPDLPALPIRMSPIHIGEDVVLVGNGHGRGEPIELEGKRGWQWSESSGLRWGTNRIAALHDQLSINVGDSTSAFSTEFTYAATEHEAQVTVGDSGGAVFTKRNGLWELAGILVAANNFEEQPPRTAFYGNVAFAANLSAYRDQILEIIRGKEEPSASICGEGFAFGLLIPVALLARRRLRVGC